ncbi:hypothetical protein RclHR1_09220008 [Rhizophagus clarus]|uniref:Uncharacterized protein n=1 Tax=Rhizophagus clarus TaxID=94130 RepID=A0A2Z6SI26_9GLOM|nr:hypothetical protein RclHR1_09220008 [Rhizophagus clarus]
MNTLLINCLAVDDYSNENALELRVNENETIGNFIETIKESNKSNIGFNNVKFLKVASDKLSDKLAFLEDNPYANIKEILGGEELNANKTTVLEYFDTGNYYIIIIPSYPRFTFKKCADEKKLVPGDKIFYQYSNGYLMSEIINTSNKLQIKCIKNYKEYFLDSFSKFIKLAISPSNIESKNWRNLWVELYESKERLIWRDFRHRVLNEGNGMVELYFSIFYLTLVMCGSIINVMDTTNQKRIFISQQTGENLASRFWNTIYLNIDKIIPLPKKMKETRDSNDTDYNRIHLGKPTVSIINGDNTKRIDASSFFSTNATLSRGTSADTHSKAEYLYNKLVSKKDAIDCIFESQPVCAIGPYFHENNTFPFIACWGIESLGQQTVEKLEKLFDYKFKVVFHQITEPDHCGNELSSNSGASGRLGKNRKDNHGSSNNSGDRKFISVMSKASVESEDHSHIQNFDIDLFLHAEIEESIKIPQFFIDINVNKCETNFMLSEIWKELSNVGQGYSLESVKIIISPISDVPGYGSTLVTRDDHYPRKMLLSDEWTLKTRGNIIKWLYKKSNNDIKLSFAPGHHDCSGFIDSEHLCGFRITVIQVFKFMVYRNIISSFGNRKPKLIMCPQISHNLEITFNDLKDFNKKFAKLLSS